MAQKNHFQINRRLFEHPLWLEEPFTKGQAWVDLIGSANYKDGYFIKKGQRIDVARGQSGTSMLTFAKRWQWSRGKVKRFFVFLEKEQMIVQQTGHLTTLVSICNYDVYQLNTDDGDTADKTSNGHRTDIERTSDGTHPKRIKEEPNKNRKEYLADSVEFRVANFLYKNILQNKADFLKPDLQEWASDADKMIRIDGRNVETVKKVIAWCSDDDFEKSKVLSIFKLRKRFDGLEMQMNKPPPKKNAKREPEEKEEEHSWQEIADAMEPDGEYGIKLNFNKKK